MNTLSITVQGVTHTYRTHSVKCGRAVAHRLLALGRCALGYPLPDGTWSTDDGPFQVGERVALVFTSAKGKRWYGTVIAVVKDERRPDLSDAGALRGAFVAHFEPITHKVS